MAVVSHWKCSTQNARDCYKKDPDTLIVDDTLSRCERYMVRSDIRKSHHVKKAARQTTDDDEKYRGALRRRRRDKIYGLARVDRAAGIFAAKALVNKMRWDKMEVEQDEEAVKTDKEVFGPDSDMDLPTDEEDEDEQRKLVKFQKMSQKKMEVEIKKDIKQKYKERKAKKVKAANGLEELVETQRESEDEVEEDELMDEDEADN